MGLPLRNTQPELSASYGNIALPSSGKQGILKVLDKGYYEIILGAFSAFGNGGWLYDLDSARRYVEQDAEFLFALNNGRMSSEWGHPVREAGMTDQEWFVRINEIRESNTCCHIRRIRISMDTVKDEHGRWVAAVIGEICPSGKQASDFRNMLENPHEDVNFSVRSFARKNFSNMTKHITKIVTWDSVRSPGIAVASKYNTPSLESKAHVAQILDTAEFNLQRLRRSFEEPCNDVSFESAAPMIAIIDAMYREQKIHSSLPNFLSW